MTRMFSKKLHWVEWIMHIECDKKRHLFYFPEKKGNFNTFYSYFMLLNKCTHREEKYIVSILEYWFDSPQ